jgi:hypothetical protein
MSLRSLEQSIFITHGLQSDLLGLMLAVEAIHLKRLLKFADLPMTNCKWLWFDDDCLLHTAISVNYRRSGHVPSRTAPTEVT